MGRLVFDVDLSLSPTVSLSALLKASTTLKKAQSTSSTDVTIGPTNRNKVEKVDFIKQLEAKYGSQAGQDGMDSDVDDGVHKLKKSQKRPRRNDDGKIVDVGDSVGTVIFLYRLFKRVVLPRRRFRRRLRAYLCTRNER
jgi:hypothetical protein